LPLFEEWSAFSAESTEACICATWHTIVPEDAVSMISLHHPVLLRKVLWEFTAGIRLYICVYKKLLIAGYKTDANRVP